MKIKLYKQFENWYHGGTIWLYSDPHFDDPEAYKMNPNWMSSEEQVKRINENLSKNDTIIFLGDIGNEEWVKKIKGYKVLIMGNHDKGKTNYEKKFTVHGAYKPDLTVNTFEEAVIEREYRIFDTSNADVRISNNGLFDEVYEGPIFINDKVLLSHEPIDIHFGINIFGHCHAGNFSSLLYKDKYAKFNVCSNIVDFNKIRLDKLVEKAGSKIKNIHEVYLDSIRRKNNDC